MSVSLLRCALLACLGLPTLFAASWEQVVTVGGVGREVFIPDTSRPVKAVLISNWKDPNAAGRPDIYYANADLRALGRKWNMMQMHWIGRHESDAALTQEFNALVETLNQVATSLGKPEIAVTPMFLQGLSGTANNAASMAKKAPGRMGGVIQHHYSYQSAPEGVPCLYVVGGLDNTVYSDITLTQQLERVAPRAAAGEPATLYLEPAQYHDTAATDQKFPALWLDEILTLRFPANIPTSSFSLPSWKNYRAWVGCTDPSSDSAQPWNRGARGINNYIQAYPYSGGRPSIWLPSKRVADAWKAFMDTGVFPATAGTVVALTAPVGGTEYAAGATVNASATASAVSGSITRVEFYDNGTLAGSDTSSTGGWNASWTISSTTAHTLTAKAINSSGETVVSAAVSVQVRSGGDTTPPATPGTPVVSSGNGTSTPTLSGVSEAGATIRVLDGGTQITTTIVNGNGTWNAALTLGAGSHTLTVTATDVAGNRSSASPSVVVTVTSGAVKVNFQPATSASVSGYLVDSGLVYGARGGQTYGWNLVNTETRDRDLTSDQLKDTLIHMQKASNPNAVWEIALANGTYQVHVVSGDPGHFDGTYKIDAEGVRVIDATPTDANRWFEGTVTVTISDGRLTLRSATGAINNKVCYLEIIQVLAGSG